ncbi:MAG: Rhodanese-like [Chlamydiales bacterium]|nr:Rhodanese-like [Chlamydiales bacterium]
MRDNKALFIDVREADECALGYIPGALLLPLSRLSKEGAAQMAPLPQQALYIYCRSGGRAKQALSLLKPFLKEGQEAIALSFGFQELHHFLQDSFLQ